MAGHITITKLALIQSDIGKVPLPRTSHRQFILNSISRNYYSIPWHWLNDSSLWGLIVDFFKKIGNLQQYWKQLGVLCNVDEMNPWLLPFFPALSLLTWAALFMKCKIYNQGGCVNWCRAAGTTSFVNFAGRCTDSCNEQSLVCIWDLCSYYTTYSEK